MKKIKAVIFDVDGVLLDSKKALYLLFKHALIEHGYKHKTKAQIIKHMGLTSEKWIKKLVPNVGKKELKKMAEWTRNKYAREYMLDHAKPMKNSIHLIGWLRKKKVKIGVVTNMRDIEAKTLLNILRLKPNSLVTSSHVKNPKPAPDPLFHALKELKCKKDEVIFIGDTITDLKAGRSAEITTYILNHKYNKDIGRKRIKSLLYIKDIIKNRD